MAKRNIEELREHLFAELADLRNPEKKHDKDRTRAVVEVAQTIINSAKAETEFLSAIGGRHGTGFIPEPAKVPAAPALQAGKPRRRDDELPVDPSSGWMDRAS